MPKDRFNKLAKEYPIIIDIMPRNEFELILARFMRKHFKRKKWKKTKIQSKK